MPDPVHEHDHRRRECVKSTDEFTLTVPARQGDRLPRSLRPEPAFSDRPRRAARRARASRRAAVRRRGSVDRIRNFVARRTWQAAACRRRVAHPRGFAGDRRIEVAQALPGFVRTGSGCDARAPGADDRRGPGAHLQAGSKSSCIRRPRRAHPASRNCPACRWMARTSPIDAAAPDPALLSADSAVAEETLCSALFRSNCPVTGAPDYADVMCAITGRASFARHSCRTCCRIAAMRHFTKAVSSGSTLTSRRVVVPIA